MLLTPLLTLSSEGILLMATEKRGDILHLNVEIECGKPESDGTRLVRLLIGGVGIFEAPVYDTDPTGRRTNEWARYGLLKIFGSRLDRILGEE